MGTKNVRVWILVKTTDQPYILSRNPRHRSYVSYSEVCMVPVTTSTPNQAERDPCMSLHMLSKIIRYMYSSSCLLCHLVP